MRLNRPVETSCGGDFLSAAEVTPSASHCTGFAVIWPMSCRAIYR